MCVLLKAQNFKSSSNIKNCHQSQINIIVGFITAIILIQFVIIHIQQQENLKKIFNKLANHQINNLFKNNKSNQ